MQDPLKTHPELIEDISFLKQRIKELEQSEVIRERTEAALRKSEAKFKEIFETIEDLYYETDSEGIVKIVSPSLHCLTGWNEEDVIGEPAIKFYVAPNDRERLYLKLSEKGYVHDYEVVLKRKDGEERLASLSARLIIGDNGQPIGLRGLLRDITERKRAEEALGESELKFRALFDSANDAIFIMKDHIIIDCNRKTLDMFCCDKESIIGCSPVDFSPEIQPDGLLSSEKATEKINMALKGIPQCFEWKHRRMDGTLFDTEVSLNNIELSDNTYLQVIARDITSHKRVEEVLFISETRLRQVIDLVPHFIFAKDRGGRFILANKAVADAYGTTVEDLTGKTDGDFSPNKDEVNHFLKDDLLVMNSGQPKEIREEYITDSKGNIRILQTIKIPFALSLKGDDAILGVSTDITEHMLAEEALRKSEAKYHSLFDNAMEGIFQTTPEGRAISVNPYLTKLLGYDSPLKFTEQITDISKHYANQEDRATYKEILETEGIIRGFEVKLIDKEGKPIWVSINAQAIKSDKGMVLYYEGTMEDITERKHAEEDLRESECKFRDLAEKSVAGVYLVQDGIFKYVNLRFAQVLGYTIDEMIGKVTAEDVIFSEDWPIVEENLRKRLSGELESLYYAFRICTKNGEIRNAEVYSSRTVYKGRPAVIGTLLDITERKQAEGKLKQQANAMEASMDGIAILNEDQKCVYVNEAHTRIYGYDTSEELIGQSWRILYDDDELLRFDHNIMPEFSKKGQWQGEATGKKNDGSAFPQEISLTALDNGGLICVVRDITNRRKTEEELRIAHQRLFDIIEFLPDATFVIDQERKVIAWNKAIETMTGIRKEDILGKGDYAYAMPFYGEPRPILIDMIFRGTVENSKNSCDFITKEGSTFSAEGRVTMTHQEKDAFLSATASPFFDTKGQAIGAIESIRDITEHRRVERELQESEERYRIVIESSNDGIAIMKGDEHLYVNQRFVEMFGYDDPNEIIGKSNRKTVHPDDFQIVSDINVRRQKREPVPARYEFKGIKKDSTPVYLDVSATGTRYQGDCVSLVYLRDITDRKHAEDEITRERQKLKTLSDNAPFGMVLINNEGRFTYINRKFTELFGYNLSDIPDSRTWRRKAYPDSGYRHAIISAWLEDRKDAKPGELKPNILAATCKDETQKIVRFIYSVLASGDYLMTCEDITEMRHLENQLRQAQKMEAIGTLAGGIAHDFNNFLTVITGYAALIQIKVDTADPLRPYVDQVLMASEKASDLTQSLLAFSRQQPVTLVPLDINNIIKAAEKLLRRLLTEDIEFSTSLTDDDMVVMADKSQMDQILFNLVANARNAMPNGGALTIETAIAVIDNTFIRVHGFGESGNYVQINITDTGMGMDEITRSKIFDPFFTTKAIGKGTGLGLATVYGIVKTHNGYIMVESEPGQGTTFRVYLPHVRVNIVETEDKTISPTGGKETILIAEDNEGVRRYMREVLQKYGYTIMEAIDGEDAVERFKEHQDIDLIIIDSVMPKKNGRETYEEIHKMDPHIKVIFTSGYTKDIVLDKGIEDEKFDFIAKPLSLNKLLQKVKEVLDR